MIVTIANAHQQTLIFIIILSIVFLFLLKKNSSEGLFSIKHTQEIKGFAILSIIFAHVGYYLVNDTQFLFPVSILAGVGIELFLFLSAFGLTTSALNKSMTILQFYKRRLLKLFIPLWLILGIFIALDYFVLHITYSTEYILTAFAGIFTHANLYEDINSPFWYFTFILFYYLVFPLFFSKKYTWASALCIFVITYIIVKWNPTYLAHTLPLYKIHLVSFPLGMITAWALTKKRLLSLFSLKVKNRIFLKIVRFVAISFLLLFIGYTALHSGVGKSPLVEQLVSLSTMVAILILFLIKKVHSTLFSLFGIYSYELYLFHWPILYRYDILFRYLPAWLALLIDLIVFLCLAWVLQKVVMRIQKIFENPHTTQKKTK